MAQSIDWMPRPRLLILAMVEMWINVLSEEVKDDKGQTVTKSVLWGIPAAVVNALMIAFDAARSALKAAMSEETRTPVSNKACENVFKELVAQMRAMKRKFFIIPPLTEEDLVSLGLRPHDTNRTATGTPTVQIRINPYLTGAFGEVGVAFEAIRGELRDPANKEIRVYYVVKDSGEPPSESVKELVFIADKNLLRVFSGVWSLTKLPSCPCCG